MEPTGSERSIRRGEIAALAKSSLATRVRRGQLLASADANWTSPPPGSPTFPLNANYNLRWDTSAAIIRGGVNYEFDWLTPAPVIARYECCART